MKILDSTILIAALTELNKPELITVFRQEGYQIVACDSVLSEITKEPAKTTVNKLIEKKEITISTEVTADELSEFRAHNPRLGAGECSVLLLGLKQKKKEQRYCCILDDGLARKKVETLGLKFTGTIGLLKKLVTKKLITEESYHETIYKLKQSGFRFNDSVTKLGEK